MGSVTIRNIADEIKNRARVAAVENGRSLEAELRDLLVRTYATDKADRAAQIRAMTGEDWVRELVERAGGVGLEAPRRLDRDRGGVFGAD